MEQNPRRRPLFSTSWRAKIGIRESRSTQAPNTTYECSPIQSSQAMSTNPRKQRRKRKEKHIIMCQKDVLRPSCHLCCFSTTKHGKSKGSGKVHLAGIWPKQGAGYEVETSTTEAEYESHMIGRNRTAPSAGHLSFRMVYLAEATQLASPPCLATAAPCFGHRQ